MIKLPPAKARDTEIELQEKRKTNMNNRNRLSSKKWKYRLSPPGSPSPKSWLEG
jgi:hypothetical protein